MDPSCIVAPVHAAAVIMRVTFSWHTLYSLVAYLSIVLDPVHLFITTVYLSSGDCTLQENALFDRAQVMSNYTHLYSDDLRSHEISVQ